MRYVIGPSIGVARVGNSLDEFYLAPETIGGRPLTCNEEGTPTSENGQPFVTRYKDLHGKVKRQAARFKVFAVESDGRAREVTLNDANVKQITWSVHLANKKAAWYNFAELQGNELLGAQNSYENTGVALRNADKTGKADRQKLIIDPGPRQLTGALQRSEFSSDNIPADYSFGYFPPPKPKQGTGIASLGEIRTDAQGRLLVLGGFGNAGGTLPISSFAGADGWHDDTSDGPVSCTLTLTNGETHKLRAWCIVGSPKFAPELENIVTLDDVVFDVSVREMNLIPNLCLDGVYNPQYTASYHRDIEPILMRPAGYRWVAAVPALSSFSPPPFNATDNSNATAELRSAYYQLFRDPGKNGFTDGTQNDLFDKVSGMIMMPLNSGSNSVSNDILDKFLTLTRTQYFLLGQWAAGKFTLDPPSPLNEVLDLDRVSIGNCVGGPLCPGIEVTWSLYSPALYQSPYNIRHRHEEDYYQKNGLDPSENETVVVAQGSGAIFSGCEPGDLTKRMAIPWQADFYQCTVQNVNFSDAQKNSADGVPLAPSYYAYWWPPQSPWNVLSGGMTADEQEAAGIPAGLQSIYSRGINSFSEMIQAWHYLGFVTNQVSGPHRSVFPYCSESERNHDRFVAASVAVAGAPNVVTGADANFFNTWFLAPDKSLPKIKTLTALSSRGRRAL